MQLHSCSRLGGIFDHANVGLVRALRNLDGLPNELTVAADVSAATSAASRSSSSSPSSSASTLRRMHRTGQPGGHEARHGTSSRPRASSACSPCSLSTARELEVPALADEDAAVVQHHAGVEESKIAEQVADLTLPTGVGAVDHLDE